MRSNTYEVPGTLQQKVLKEWPVVSLSSNDIGREWRHLTHLCSELEAKYVFSDNSDVENQVCYDTDILDLTSKAKRSIHW